MHCGAGVDSAAGLAVPPLGRSHATNNNVIRLSLGKLLVNLLQVVIRTNTPLTP